MLILKNKATALILQMVTRVSLCAAIGIVCGAPLAAGELSDAFVPIQDSTASDPAGFQLMIISIGILVTMVLSIFTVTLVYMAKDKAKREAARQARSAKETVEQG